jgi:hypothetical protein
LNETDGEGESSMNPQNEQGQEDEPAAIDVDVEEREIGDDEQIGGDFEQGHGE